MNEIITSGQQMLPETIEDLTQFVLVGKAKLQAYMLKLQTVNKLSVAQEIRDRMTHHEETERVTRDQARRIKGAVHARVNHVLGIELNGGLVKKECMGIDKKYRSAFFGRCYSDARKYSDLGSPYSETCQKNYKAVIDYIENWEPECEYEGMIGTKAYIAYLDDRANS